MRAGQPLPAFCFSVSYVSDVRWGLVIARHDSYCGGAPFWWAGAGKMNTQGTLTPLEALRCAERRGLRKTCLRLLTNVGVVGQDEIIQSACAIHMRRLVHTDEYRFLPQVWLHGVVR